MSLTLREATRYVLDNLVSPHYRGHFIAWMLEGRPLNPFRWASEEDARCMLGAVVPGPHAEVYPRTIWAAFGKHTDIETLDHPTNATLGMISRIFDASFVTQGEAWVRKEITEEIHAWMAERQKNAGASGVSTPPSAAPVLSAL